MSNAVNTAMNCAVTRVRTGAPRVGRHAVTLRRLLAAATTVVTVLILYLGWVHRHDGLLTPEEGLGYGLGVTGAAMMAALAGYPLRKRIPGWRRCGALKSWFRMHMVLGLVGPILILFHANFQTGSLNSTIALWSMITVVASGIVGRYLYARIHDGLYGKHLRLSDLRQRLDRESDRLAIVLRAAPKVAERLHAYETRALRAPKNVIHGVVRIVAAGIATRWGAFVLGRRARRSLARVGRAAGWDAERLARERAAVLEYIDGYLDTVRRVVEFGFYERLFAAWHVLHVPLFVLLGLAALVHVVAVHTY